MILQDVMRFLAQGLAADRPAMPLPSSTPWSTDPLRFYLATDTGALSLWIGDSAGSGAWFEDLLAESFVIACSDETTALVAGTGLVTFRMPYAMRLTEVRASLTTAQSAGTTLKVDVNEGGTSILGASKLTFDNGQDSTGTAAQSGVTITTLSSIADATIANNAKITIDIDALGDGSAKGLKVSLIGHRI